MQASTTSMIRLFLCLLCASASLSAEVALPDIGDASEKAISRSEEREYGEAMMRYLQQLGVVINDPQVSEYIEHLGYRLVASSDAPENDYRFFVLREPVVNAFAAPGGLVGVHSGLVLVAEEESELAAVLAHEIAHVSQRHIARAFHKAQKATIPIALATIGAILASGGDGDVVQGALLGGVSALQQARINFTRANEYEADRLGIQTLSNAGFDPDAMAGFFGKMAQANRSYSEFDPPEFLRTHPVSGARISEARGRAAQMPAQQTEPEDELLFHLMRERMRVLQEDNPVDAIAFYRNVLSGSGVVHEEASRYGLAMALTLDGQHGRARPLLEDLLERRQGYLSYELLAAQSDFLSGHREAAIQRYEKLAARYPSNEAVSVQYAESLLQEGGRENGRKAQDLAGDLVNRHPRNPAIRELFGRAAVAAGNEIRAGEAFAEYHFLSGRPFDATQQLERLFRRTDLDYYQRQRIAARIEELKPLAIEQAREQRGQL